MKVVYNGCYGGFGLSHEGVMRYAEIKGLNLYGFVVADNRKFVPATPQDIKECGGCVHYATTSEYSNDSHWSYYDLERDDPALVQVVEELGDKASGMCSKLRIEDIPKGTLWRIDEYDGNESVMTQGSYEWKVST